MRSSVKRTVLLEPIRATTSERASQTITSNYRAQTHLLPALAHPGKPMRTAGPEIPLPRLESTLADPDADSGGVAGHSDFAESTSWSCSSRWIIGHRINRSKLREHA